MTRLCTIFGLIVGLLTAPAVALAGDRPVLRSEVHTLSDIVTVGDFFTGAGEHADVPLFRSPDLGTSGTVPADLVVKRARAAGLLAAQMDGLRSVVVHRRAEVFDDERLKPMIQAALAGRDAGVLPADLAITFYNVPGTIEADPAADDPIRVERVLWSRTDGRFSVNLSVAGAGGRLPVTVTGHAMEMIEVAVLQQPMRRGALLRQEDVTSIRMPRAKIPARALTDLTDVIGLAARSGLRANMPLARSDFAKPILISRGEKVTITYEIAGMKLTTRGKAMDDGAKGDLIDVMNPQSRRIIPAMVASRGQVVAQPATARIASLKGPAE